MPFFGVVRAGRVARGRTDAQVLFLDQRFVTQFLVFGIAPVLLAHLFVQPFGAGLGQAVGECLDHDRAVVVAFVLIGLGDFFGANAGGGDETTDIVGHAAVFRCHEVGQGEVGLAVGLDGLLAQMVQQGQWLAILPIDFDVVVVDLVGRPEAEHCPGADQFFIDQLAQHLLGVRTAPWPLRRPLRR